MGVKCELKISKGSQILKEVSHDVLNQDIGTVVKSLKSLKSENDQFLTKLVEAEKLKNKTGVSGKKNQRTNSEDDDMLEDEDSDDEESSCKPTDAKKQKL